MDKLEAMQLFIRLADLRSLSQAASASGVSRATASKQLSAMEATLGVELISRAGRDLTLTASGRIYYTQVRQIFDGLERAEARIEKGQTSPSGILRVTMAPSLGRMYVLPHVRGFLERYPAVLVDIEMSERMVNLVAEGVDLAIRTGALADSSMVARRIGTVRDVTVGTPAYFAKHGSPRHPKDTEKMPCVACISEGAALPWRYRDGESALTVEPRGRVRSNDAEYVRACVLMGLGMGHGPEWLFADDIRSGALVEVLDGHAAPPQALSIVTPAGRRNPGKAQAFIDYLAERFQGKPPVDTDSLTATAGVVQVRRLA